MNLSAQITPLLLGVTLSWLAWGLLRSRKQGRLALLSWLQNLTLILPWLVFLGLLTLGVYLNVVGFVLLLVVSTAIYIGLGGWIRKLATGDFSTRPSGSTVSSDPTVSSDGAPKESQPRSSEAGYLDSPLPQPQPLTLTLSLSPEDRELIQGIFSLDSFFTTETIPYGEGAIFKGNLRSDPEIALQRLTQRLEERLGDRFRVYLVEDFEEKPAVVVLPDKAVNTRTSRSAFGLAIGLMVATLLTLLETGANFAGFELISSPQRWGEALPVAVGILSLLILHEWGHRWIAGRYGVRLSPAFIIPSLGLGTLGSLTRIESPVPTRKALFDIALAGPAMGGLISLAILGVGIWLSPMAGLVYVPRSIFDSSILVGVLARIGLGSALNSVTVAIHPLVVIGWIGLGVNALNLLPAGQLDGGRMVQAIYGRKMAGRSTLATLIVLGLAALGNVIALYWALVILLVAREPERPPLNELSEPVGLREGLGLLALFLAIMTLLPITPILASGLSRVLG